jgi:hypothetical protein
MRTKSDFEAMAKGEGLARCFAVFPGNRASTVIQYFDAGGSTREIVIEDESVLTDEQVRLAMRKAIATPLPLDHDTARDH